MTLHDSDGIDQSELPPAVAERFRVALDLDEPPASLADWADATAEVLAAADFTLGIEELCLADGSRHEVHVDGETHHVRCVLDALLVPFVYEGDGEITVRSRDPGTDRVVEFAVGSDDVVAAPDGAVVSLGLGTDVDPPSERDSALGAGYGAFCPYVDAFPDVEAYENWADGHPDAATMPISIDEAFAIARRIAREHQASGGR